MRKLESSLSTEGIRNSSATSSKEAEGFPPDGRGGSLNATCSVSPISSLFADERDSESVAAQLHRPTVALPAQVLCVWWASWLALWSVLVAPLRRGHVDGRVAGATAQEDGFPSCSTFDAATGTGSWKGQGKGQGGRHRARARAEHVPGGLPVAAAAVTAIVAVCLGNCRGSDGTGQYIPSNCRSVHSVRAKSVGAAEETAVSVMLGTTKAEGESTDRLVHGAIFASSGSIPTFAGTLSALMRVLLAVTSSVGLNIMSTAVIVAHGWA